MKIFDLVCSNGHRFEGWFASAGEYDRQKQDALLNCPVCTTTEIERLPSAPHIGKTRADKEAPTLRAETSEKAGAPGQAVTNVNSGLLDRLVEYVVRHTENVGPQFPEEARKIHYGEVADRHIRGTASRDEVKSLQEEGIEILALPSHLTAKRH